MFLFRKKITVICPFPVLFKIMEEDLLLGICCDISFTLDGKKHSLGVYGDKGNTYENVKYYLDKIEVDNLDVLKNLTLKGIPLEEFQEPVIINECDGMYPEETKLLSQYISD